MQQARSISGFSFNDLGTTGECHQPVFKVEAVVTRRGQTFKGAASAGNKKLAKTLAAAEVLKKLGINVDVEDTSSEYSAEETAVSYLNRYAQQTGCRMPQYSETRKGPDHAPTFKVTVQFKGYTAVGSAGSKKAAKEEAAKKMMNMI